MKSCVIDSPANTQLDLQCMPVHALLEDDYFATVPVIAVRPALVRRSENEEELYTSFEEAISGRVERVSCQLSQLSRSSTSGYLSTVQSSTHNTEVLAVEWAVNSSRLSRLWRARRRAITLICLGLSLLLIGFDLMGLLVLSR